MLRRKMRDQYTPWFNDRPINNVHEALDFLKQQSYVSGEAFHLHHNREGWWELVEPWYSEGDSGGDQSGWNYYQIEEAVALQLVSAGLVAPREVPRMGYTQTIEDELVITQKGQEELAAFGARMVTIAKSMLRPGIHTDLTGEVRQRGSGRRHRSYGPYYVRILGANDEFYRVYPELGKIEGPSQE